MSTLLRWQIRLHPLRAARYRHDTSIPIAWIKRLSDLLGPFQLGDYLSPTILTKDSKKRIKCSPLEIKASEAPAFPNKGSKVRATMGIAHGDSFLFERLPTTKTNFHPSRSFRYLERTDALRALSQTCKLWRHLFFPLLWERLESCLTRPKSAIWYSKVHGESLIRKSSLVCENLEIASHVRCVCDPWGVLVKFTRSMSVILSRYSTSIVLPAFVRVIEALPNLHTLQFIQTHPEMSTVLKSTFDGHTFGRSLFRATLLIS